MYLLSDKEIRDLLNELHPKGETIKEQMSVYMREMGDLASAAMYMQIHPDCSAGYRGEILKAMGDILMQMRITHIYLDKPFDVMELINMGEQEFLNRMNRIKQTKEKLRGEKE
jgi:hypothetical protein